MTPMNHKKAIPANGTSWRLNPDEASSLRICLECLKSALRQAIRIMVRPARRSTAKTIPAASGATLGCGVRASLPSRPPYALSAASFPESTASLRAA